MAGAGTRCTGEEEEVRMTGQMTVAKVTEIHVEYRVCHDSRERSLLGRHGGREGGKKGGREGNGDDGDGHPFTGTTLTWSVQSSSIHPFLCSSALFGSGSRVVVAVARFLPSSLPACP